MISKQIGSGVVLLFDDDDFEQASLAFAEFRVPTHGVPQVKFRGWKRWKDLSVYLTGAICAPRNGNPLDLQRENLLPVGQGWLHKRKYC